MFGDRDSCMRVGVIADEDSRNLYEHIHTSEQTTHHRPCFDSNDRRTALTVRYSQEIETWISLRDRNLGARIASDSSSIAEIELSRFDIVLCLRGLSTTFVHSLWHPARSQNL